MSSRRVADMQSDDSICETTELQFGILIAAGEWCTRIFPPIRQNGIIWKRKKSVEIRYNKVPQGKKMVNCPRA
jgi:hypothetical protein